MAVDILTAADPDLGLMLGDNTERICEALWPDMSKCSGKAAWVIAFRCPICLPSTATWLICEPRYRFVHNPGADCSSCSSSLLAVWIERL